MRRPVASLGGHFLRLRPEQEDDHPVDRLVAALGEVWRADREARRLGRRLAERPEERLDAAVWLRYDDLRMTQRAVRQEAYFDAGWAMGAVARAASLNVAADGRQVRGPEIEALGLEMTRLVFAAPLDRDRASAVLLQIARALIVGVDVNMP